MIGGFGRWWSAARAAAFKGALLILLAEANPGQGTKNTGFKVKQLPFPVLFPVHQYSTISLQPGNSEAALALVALA